MAEYAYEVKSDAFWESTYTEKKRLMCPKPITKTGKHPHLSLSNQVLLLDPYKDAISHCYKSCSNSGSLWKLFGAS